MRSAVMPLENRREIARQPSAKIPTQPGRAPPQTNAPIPGARIFRDTWEVRKMTLTPQP